MSYNYCIIPNTELVLLQISQKKKGNSINNNINYLLKHPYLLDIHY